MISADPPSASLSADILTDWTDDGTGNITHAYRIVLSEELDFADLNNLSVSIEHENASGENVGTWTLDWTGGNNTELRVVLPTEINWKDEIDISVSYDGGEIGSRTVLVTIWNEPMSDHEITRTTLMQMDHEASNSSASESYSLNFVGQGWQERVGDNLESNELGTGTLAINESIEGGTVSILMSLSTVWLNETTVGIDLQSQIFEMHGNGTLELHTNNDGMNVEVAAQVVNSYIVRNWIDGVVEEKLRLEASGNLSLDSTEGGDTITADGALSLLLLETHDIDGQRVLENTEFQATADMVIDSSDSHMTLDVDQLIMEERWENGVFVSSLDILKADGSFDFSNSEENSTMVVNGTVHNIYQKSVDGLKTDDQLHVDGTFSGDINGDFGIVRDILQSGPQANATGQMFQVNVIHTESWVNLTGAGSNLFDIEAVHNNTWDYEVPQDHWENRTVRLRWDSNEGGEPSAGDEYPERSPNMTEMETPEPESAIGDVDITRETGFSPAEMIAGDRLSLLNSELMDLTITATHTGTVNRDGHSLPVTYWSGNYESNGTASGAVISEGILAGLVAEVTRQVTIDLSEEESVTLSETQSLARVLSPSIVTAGENTAPVISSVEFREGSLINENGIVAHLEVTVSDPDWNVRTVSVDFSEIGLGTVELNDIGLDGDTAIHDDVFTTQISYSGTIEGTVSIGITVADDFATTDDTSAIQILNRIPRVTEISYSPSTLYRGDNTTVTLTAIDSSGVASVGVDTTQWGGGLTLLTQAGTSWSGEIQMPLSIPSGNQVLPVWVKDNADGEGTTTMLTIVESGDSDAIGPYTTELMPPIHLLNEGPVVSNVTFWEDGEIVTELNLPESGSNLYVLTAHVIDGDMISVVQAKLSTLAPAGQGESWLPMVDDGQGADATAGDGIYSIEVQVRSGVPSGTVTFDIRGLDIQGAQTPPADRTFSIQITTSGGGGGGSETIFEGASTPWVILLIILLVIVSAGVGIYVMMRKTDFEEIMGVETLDSKESYVQAIIKQGYPEDTARAHVEKHADRFKEE